MIGLLGSMAASLAIPCTASAQSQIIPLYAGPAPGTEGWTQKEISVDLDNRRFTPPAPDTVILNDKAHADRCARHRARPMARR
jgi:hypothetical protein